MESSLVQLIFLNYPVFGISTTIPLGEIWDISAAMVISTIPSVRVCAHPELYTRTGIILELQDVDVGKFGWYNQTTAVGSGLRAGEMEMGSAESIPAVILVNVLHVLLIL